MNPLVPEFEINLSKDIFKEGVSCKMHFELTGVILRVYELAEDAMVSTTTQLPVSS